MIDTWGGLSHFLKKSSLALARNSFTENTHKKFFINESHHGCDRDALLTKYIIFIINFILQFIRYYIYLHESEHQYLKFLQWSPGDL